TLRLGFESNWIDYERGPVIDPDAWWTLQEELHLEPAALERRLSAAVPQRTDLNYRLYSVTGGQRQLLLQGEEPIGNGRVVVFGEHRSRRALVDFDVEIAQASFIADPLTALVHTGSSVAVNLLPLPDGSFVAEVVARHAVAEENEPILLGYSAMDGASRNPVSFEESGLVVRLRPGTPTTLELPGRKGSTFALELSVPAAAAPAKDPNLLYLPSLAKPPIGFKAPPSITAMAALGYYEGEDEDEPYRRGLDEVLDGSPGASDYLLVMEDSGFLAFEDRVADGVLDALRQVALRDAESADLEVELRLFGTGRAADGEVLARFAAPVVLDTWSGFTNGTVREGIADWDVEVAQSARGADPIFKLVEDGVRASLRLRNRDEIELDLEIVTFDGFKVKSLKIGHMLLAGGGDQAGMPMQPEERVSIEEPVSSSMHMSGTYPLKAGELRMTRSSESLFGAGTHLEVRVKVSK
ncbi:MAG TPA: hypothetical protein VGC54_05625, partial [Planctomycetota bacterium]